MTVRKRKTDQPIRLWMRRAQEITALHEIFEIAAAADPHPVILQRIVEQISHATRIPIVAIELYDEETKTMTLKAATGVDARLEQSVLATKALSGSVVQTRTPVIAANPSREHKAEFWFGGSAKTVACFPIQVDNRCLGALTLAHPEWAELRPDLQRWAACAAVFLGSFLSWSIRTEQGSGSGWELDHCLKVMRSIQDLAQAASANEQLRDFFAAVHQKLLQVMPAENLYFATLNPANRKVSIEYFSDLLQTDTDQREYVDSDYIRSIAESGEPLRLSNQAWLGVPVKSGDSIAGAIAVYSYNSEIIYGTRERELLEYVAGVVASVLDRRQVELRSNSTQDEMTGLPNAQLFRYLLNQTLARARRNKELLAVLVLDLDHFKKFRKEKGERVASSFVKQTAGRLKRNAREGDTLGRWGDDLFIWAISGLQKIDDVALIAEKLLAIVSHPVYVEGQEHALTTSIGISLFPYDGGDLDSLIRDSEAALIRAKEMGRNTYQFFTGELNAKIADQLHVRRQVEEALRQHEFIPYYQPVVDMKTGKIVSVEALARWKNSEGKITYPEEFLSVSEDNGLIAILDEWVLRSACEWAARPLQSGSPAIRVSVNLSSEIFQRADFMELISRILKETRVNPNLLELELSEQTLRDNLGKSLQILPAVRNLGVHLCIDGFGSGGVPVALLKHIDSLKIDASLIQSARRTGDFKSLSPLVSLGHAVSAQVIAKGIETSEDLEFVRVQQCDGYQGNFFSPPVDPQTYENRWGPGLEKTEIIMEKDKAGAKKPRPIDEPERLPWPVTAALPDWTDTSIPVDLMDSPLRSPDPSVSSGEPAPRLKLYSFPGEPQRAKFPESKEYFILCATCGKQFDALATQWCFCLVSERTLTCPRCNLCFCNASLEYKLDFWTNAPQGMWDRRIAEEKENEQMQPNPKPEEVVRPLVLVVDDERQVLKIAMRSINDLGYGVIVASNGAEGLDMAREYLPDMVLSDALMPKMDGREMCRLLKRDARLRKTKVVIMNSLAIRSKDKLAAFREFGMDDYVQKPLEFTALRQLLAKYLGQNSV
jgi:diguanylate cyclase (GGDEF)-like protein